MWHVQIVLLETLWRHTSKHVRKDVVVGFPDSMSHHTGLLQKIMVDASCGMKEMGMTWRRYDMKTHSALLALYDGNPPICGGFPLCTVKSPVIWDAMISVWSHFYDQLFMGIKYHAILHVTEHTQNFIKTGYFLYIRLSCCCVNYFDARDWYYSFLFVILSDALHTFSHDMAVAVSRELVE